VGDWAMNFNLLLAALGAVLVLLLVVFGLRFLYGYRIHNQAIEVMLFHAIPVYRVPIRDIDHIGKASWGE